jgi:hypothetical protein
MRSGGTLRASRNPRTASAADIGAPEGSKPRRFTYSCPSGKRAATWCAQCSASAVLPTPAVPPIAEITTVPGLSPHASSKIRVSAASSAARPVKSATAAGNCRGTTRVNAANQAIPVPAPTAARARPTATQHARTGHRFSSRGSQMRVLIASAGGRGDVAPFTGLAAAIRAAGHTVTITSNDEYESLVVGCGLKFRPLPGAHGMFFDDPRWMQDLGGPASAAKLIRLLAEHVRTLNKAILAVARQDAPDVLGLSGPATVAGYHVAEGLGLPGMDLLLQPGHTTADFPPSFVTGRSFGRFGNRAAGMAMTTGLATCRTTGCSPRWRRWSIMPTPARRRRGCAPASPP